MPKSKPRKKTGKSGDKSTGYGANIGQTSSRTNLIAGVVGVAVLAAVGAYWWQGRQADSQSEQVVASLVQEGQGALEQVRSTPDQGNSHLSPGQTKNYVEPFPTSGEHASSALKPGFYKNEMPKVNLVHSLEHGNIVIYYENPGEDALAQLQEWTSLYTGNWDGVVATASPGLGSAVVLTAWTKILRLEEFDAAGAAAFLDLYRGRGPENRVR